MVALNSFEMKTELKRQTSGHTSPKTKVIFLITIVFNVIIFSFYITYGFNLSGIPLSSLANETVRLTTVESKVAKSPISMICDRKTTKVGSPPCLCYLDMEDNVTDPILVTSYELLQSVSNYGRAKCVMTVFPMSRLGNLMGQYASLYGLAKLNKRQAFMLPEMDEILSKYFKLTLPVLSKPLAYRIQWTNKWIHDWMEESFVTGLKGQFIRLMGFPTSFTFYGHVAEEIKQEFTLRDNIQNTAQQRLRDLAANRSSTTFVGVHVRRGDYVLLMNLFFKGVLAETDFFVRAFDYFRSHYSDAIFVVVSNAMNWCEKNIPNDRGDVYFIGNRDESDPITDFSLLVNCNHTIFTMGTYGYWAAYLTGGEVIYLANFTSPDSLYHNIVHDEALHLPQWIPIAANL